MKEMDWVELIAEKEEYAREGVHKGMNEWMDLPPGVHPAALAC